MEQEPTKKYFFLSHAWTYRCMPTDDFLPLPKDQYDQLDFGKDPKERCTSYVWWDDLSRTNVLTVWPKTGKGAWCRREPGSTQWSDSEWGTWTPFEGDIYNVGELTTTTRKIKPGDAVT